MTKTKYTMFLLICAFAAAFGYVEAAVVIYLRQIPHLLAAVPETTQQDINLGIITFLPNSTHTISDLHIAAIEKFREAATLIMLIVLALLAGTSVKEKIGTFLIGFAVWDLTYYLWLKLVTGWPQTLLTPDVFFLIPLAWVGPVITPLFISCFLLISGMWLFLH